MKYTVVPAFFFRKESTYEILSEAVQLSETDKVEYKELPQYKAVLVYYGDEDRASLMIRETESLAGISYYNKVLVYAPGDGMVDILIAVGKELKIVNSFRAGDSATALYYLVTSMEQFGLKPRMTVLNIFGKDVLDISCIAEHLFKGVEVVS